MYRRTFLVSDSKQKQVYLPTPMDRTTLLNAKSTISHCLPSLITRQRASVDSKLLHRPRNVGYLARLANLTTGLYILPSVISCFFFTRSKAISVSAGPIFTIFSPNGRYWHEFSWSGPFFPITQVTLSWQPILCLKQNTNRVRLLQFLHHIKAFWV